MEDLLHNPVREAGARRDLRDLHLEAEQMEAIPPAPEWTPVRHPDDVAMEEGPAEMDKEPPPASARACWLCQRVPRNETGVKATPLTNVFDIYYKGRGSIPLRVLAEQMADAFENNVRKPSTLIQRPDQPPVPPLGTEYFFVHLKDHSNDPCHFLLSVIEDMRKVQKTCMHNMFEQMAGTDHIRCNPDILKMYKDSTDIAMRAYNTERSKMLLYNDANALLPSTIINPDRPVIDDVQRDQQNDNTALFEQRGISRTTALQ